MNEREAYPPGSTVKVWIGALTGSPGVPPPNPQTVTCRLDHWNSVGQAYVYILNNEKTSGGNVGQYVFAPAIIGMAEELA